MALILFKESARRGLGLFLFFVRYTGFALRFDIVHQIRAETSCGFSIFLKPGRDQALLAELRQGILRDLWQQDGR